MQCINKLIFLALFSTVFSNFSQAQTCEQFSDSDYAQAERKFSETHTRVSGVTALHIAAAAGDLEGIESALAGGININSVDSRKFTAAHFAAMRGDTSAFDLLKSKGAKLNIRNMYGVGAADWWNVVHLSDDSALRINMWDDSSAEVKEVDGAEFCKLTGATFVDGIKLRPQTAMKIWLDGKSEQALTFPGFHDVYESLKMHKGAYADTYIKKISVRETNGDDTQLGYGLFAKRDFKPGEIISFYEGEWTFAERDPEYTLDHVDASKVRGYLGFSADGPPNAVTLTLANQFGIPKVGFAIAAQSIAKGDAIMWDYGQHDIKWEIYKELAPEKVDQYLGNIKPALWLKKNEMSASSINKAFMKEFSIITYIANTPIVMIRLALEGIIDSKDARALRNWTGVTISQIEESFFDALLEGIKRARKAADVRDFFLTRVREGNIQILLLTLRLLGESSAAHSLKEVKQIWKMTHTQVCSANIDKGTKSLRGGCHLLRDLQGQDEL